MKSPRNSTPGARSSASGGNGSSSNACRGSTNDLGPDAPGPFPPEVVVQVKALACELPANPGLPLSRMSIVASISDRTVWRGLHEDAIRPWQHRCWIFPRDPDFRLKAGRILDPYEGHWNATPCPTPPSACCSGGHAPLINPSAWRLGISASALLGSIHPALTPSRPPFPSKRDLADRIGVKSTKTIQNNIRQLEDAGLIRREQRKTASGDWKRNICHFDGLTAKSPEN